MHKFIEIMHIYQEREFENLSDILNHKKESYPNTPRSGKLWFIGLNLWGRKFSNLDYEIREST